VGSLQETAGNGRSPAHRTRREEPAALTQWVDQEDAHENTGDRAGEGNRVVGADSPPGERILELNRSMKRSARKRRAAATNGQSHPAAPSAQIALGFRAPEQQQAVAHRIAGVLTLRVEKIAAFQVVLAIPVGVPTSREGVPVSQPPGPGRPWGTAAGGTSHKTKRSRLSSHRGRSNIPGLPARS